MILRTLLIHDDEVSGAYTTRTAVMCAFTEGLVCMAMLGSGLTYTFVLITYAVYLNLTSWMDYLTGYVYEAVNVLQAMIFIITLLVSGQFDLLLAVGFVLLFLFLLLCERLHAFEAGDVEFLLVSYLFFSLNAAFTECIEIILVIMLFGSTLFTIFKKISKREGESLPYTPFLSLSEIITIIFLSHLT